MRRIVVTVRLVFLWGGFLVEKFQILLPIQLCKRGFFCLTLRIGMD